MTTVAQERIQRLTISFSGPGAGTAPITWGQKVLLGYIRETGWAIDSSGAYPVAAGTTVEDVAERLSGLMSRHSSLRMRFGTDADGQPCQVVSESGELDIDVVDFDGDSKPEDAVNHGNSLWATWVRTPVDPYRQWPVRLALIRHQGVLVYQVLTIGHLASDGTSTFMLMGELGIGDGRISRRDDVPELQLLELARREQTPAVRRISDRAMGYWTEQLRDLPPLTFGEPTHPEGRLGKRYWRLRFSSPATYLAVLAIARRTRTDTSRVLLAVIGTAIGRATGVNPLCGKVVVSNRFRPGMAMVIASLSQNSVLTLDLDGTLDDVIVRARRASTAAGMHAYYDPDQLDELEARLDAERGYAARINLRINDRRLTTKPATEAAVHSETVTVARIQAAMPQASLAWEATLNVTTDQVFINVEDVAETVHLQVMLDMGCFTEAQAEAMLRGVEEVAVAAAFDSAVPTLVKPAGAEPPALAEPAK